MNKPFPNNQKLARQTFDLDGVQDSPEFNEAIDRDFGTATENFDGDSVSRRRWLQIMGASLALGSMSGCRYQEEKIAPFAFRPVDRVPGVPQQYASMIELSGVAQPIVATSYDGRPIKLDGNKKHPQSKGASSTFTQARMLEFYDPDRLRTGSVLKTRENSRMTYWEDASLEAIFEGMKPGLSNLSKVAVLAEPSQSPSLLRMKKAFTDKGGKWFHFGAVNDDNARAGAKEAFGKAVRVHNHFDKAKIIISLDADFMGVDANAVGNAVAYAKTRDADAAAQGKKGAFMSRLYVVESQHTPTGSAADHRMSVQSSKIAGFLAALVAEIDNRQKGQEVDKALPYREKLLAAMAQDIVDNAAESLIVAGECQPPAVHAAVHALNKKLGNAGNTVTYSDVPDADAEGCLDSIKAFAAAASNGEIETLIVLGGNPVYAAPQDLKIDDAIASVANRLHASCFKNETSQVCENVVDMAHALETWKDGVAADGSICIGQPLINPLFGSKSNLEMLSMLLGESADSQSIVKTTANLSINDWKQAVHDGFVKDSVAKPSGVSAGEMPTLESDDAWKTPWDGETIEFVFNPSPSMYDGQFANNAWMQELPDFTTKITWDNAALVSPKTAKALGLAQHTKATFEIDGEVTLPVHVQPGQADGSIGLAIGYGRTMAGRVGGNKDLAVKPVGEDVSPLRSSENWVVAGGLSASNITPTGTVYKLAIVQEPWDIDAVGRDEIQARMFRNKDKTETDRSSLIREGSFASFQEFAEKHEAAFDVQGHAEEGRAGEGHDEQDHAGTKPKSTALPIITNVSFNPNGARPDDVAADDAGHEEGDTHDHDHEGGDHEGGDHAHEGEGHGHDDAHGHGDQGHVEGSERDAADAVHRHAWPEAFHMHHSLFDITKGVREIYKETDPTHTNVWGKAIDLNKCIGCNSCVVACQSENNVPVVGRDDVRRGREMHWIRIDRYFGNNLYNEEAADDDDKQIVHQPVACHHCENAPCETVCPVAATVHSNEGLNDMVYNRCIGTRYCGNNCPYKVRRFNFFNYSDAKTFLKYPGADKLPAGDRNLQNLMMNPEVSIRSRGVMEKCTYCVQRIQNTKINAKAQNREIGDNEITTACQDACPTSAITFGDLNRVGSDVHADHHNPRRYSMLDELNNRPRTVYLARVRNVHPAMIDFDDRDSVHAPYGGEAAH
jgi:molybdopterin-containing oxidoreductase family iron-sulfur binding subunit